MLGDQKLDALIAWLTQAGLAGTAESDIVNGFCERLVAAGIPLGRAITFIDTLHPVHEGRLCRWGYDPSDPPVYDYGRTSPPAGQPLQSDADIRWRQSPFFRLLQTGGDFLRCRLDTEEIEFSFLAEMKAAGMTDYVAIINRFAPENVIGEMDCVYSSWVTGDPAGFTDDQLRSLKKLAPFFALAIKTVALARMTATLMETYLGRDAGQRVLRGRIIRGLADRIDAVIWFSDLRGFTRITDTAPEQVIPLLNDYADVIVTAIHGEGGDVLKLIGDGTFAIFVADDLALACNRAIVAAIAARRGIAELKGKRLAAGLPVTDMYLGLHVGQVFYGNIGSTERLDFTVVGPAVNEASRIAAMCRSVEQPILMSDAFANIGGDGHRIVSVGRYALRGVAKPQELFTLDPSEWS